VRLELGSDEFFCDLLFFHLTLRRYVVIKLKAVAFDPAFLGQLGTHMAAVDDLLTHGDDKPTIGLLLCRTKNNVVTGYALRGDQTPVPRETRHEHPMCVTQRTGRRRNGR